MSQYHLYYVYDPEQTYEPSVQPDWVCGGVMTGPIKKQWESSELRILLREMPPGAILCARRPSILACSVMQVIEILLWCNEHEITVVFGTGARFNGNRDEEKASALSLIKAACSEFISNRTKKALAKRRAAGKLIGRPRGTPNVSYKLDKYQDDIIRYRNIGISKASIAKLVHCHPQTLYDHMARHKIN